MFKGSVYQAIDQRTKGKVALKKLLIHKESSGVSVKFQKYFKPLFVLLICYF